MRKYQLVLLLLSLYFLSCQENENLGCMDSNACNYSSSATQADNSCNFPNDPCDDGNSSTSNDSININCECVGHPFSGSGSGSQLLPGNNTCANQNISVNGCGSQSTLNYNGRTYDLVEIGGQCWFAENLATEQYKNGEPIISGLDDANWGLATSGSVTIYNGDFTYDELLGKLYNWYTVQDSRGLCPTGWHVPSDCEWMYMESTLGLDLQDQEINGPRGEIGGFMKAVDSFVFVSWHTPNVGATNSSGFTGWPGGMRGHDGIYTGLQNEGYWWSSTENGNLMSMAWYRSLSYSSSAEIRGGFLSKTTGMSVRCVKD